MGESGVTIEYPATILDFNVHLFLKNDECATNILSTVAGYCNLLLKL